MNRKYPVIGILGVPVYDDDHYQVMALYDGYRNLAFSKKCIPFMIPPFLNIDYVEREDKDFPELSSEEINMYKEMVDMCDGIIIPGGCRMYPFHKVIIPYAIQNNIPVLGTCLGMQIMAILDNNEYCLVPDNADIHKKRGEKYAHSVNILENTFLSQIINKKNIKVNSVHQYCVSKVNKFVVSAYSDDGIIEAIELRDKDFVVGVQWHPERMFEYDDEANQLVDRFVDACQKRQSYKKNS